MAEEEDQIGMCPFHNVPLDVDLYGRDYCQLCQVEDAATLQENDDATLPEQ